MIWQEIQNTYPGLLKFFKDRFTPRYIKNLRIKIRCQLQFDIIDGDGEDIIASFDNEDEARLFLKELKNER